MEIENSRLEFEKEICNKNIIIYGAHLIAENICKLIQYKYPKCVIESFVVSDIKNNPTEILGIPVRGAYEYFEKHKETGDMSVIVAVPEKYWKEIANNLKNYNISDIYYIGINRTTELLGRILVEYINSTFKEIVAELDNNDSFCINVKLKKNGQNSLFLKLPVLMKNPIWRSYNIADIEKKIIEILDYNNKNITGKYKKINNESVDISGFKVYSACSHMDTVLERDFIKDKWCIDIQAGKALTEKKVSELSDDVGFSISQKNQQFAEMTVTYWAWKNDIVSQYKGLCHYRRKFDLNKNDIMNVMNEDIDVILTMPRVVFPSVKEYFYETPVTKRGFELILEVIKDIKPEYYEFAKLYYDNNIYFPNNMVIAKSEIFNEYCEWLFAILFEMENRYEEVIENYQNRYMAYSAELLTSLYFSYNMERCKTICVEYKMKK